MRVFRQTIRNEATGETRTRIVSTGRVPDVAPFEARDGWAVVWPIEELSRVPDMSREQLARVAHVWSDILSRREGRPIAVTMKNKRRRPPRVIALHDEPET